MVQKTNKEWNEKLNGAKFPYGPVNELKEVFADPQVLHNDMLQSMEHPILGQIKQVSLIKKMLWNNLIKSFEIHILGWTPSQIFKCLKYLPKSSTNIRPTYARDSLISTQLFIKRNIGTRITANHPKSKIVMMMRWWCDAATTYFFSYLWLLWFDCGAVLSARIALKDFTQLFRMTKNGNVDTEWSVPSL